MTILAGYRAAWRFFTPLVRNLLVGALVALFFGVPLLCSLRAEAPAPTPYSTLSTRNVVRR